MCTGLSNPHFWMIAGRAFELVGVGDERGGPHLRRQELQQGEDEHGNANGDYREEDEPAGYVGGHRDAPRPIFPSDGSALSLGGWSLSAPPEAGVQDVAESVAQEVPPQDKKEDNRPREDDGVPVD